MKKRKHLIKTAGLFLSLALTATTLSTAVFAEETSSTESETGKIIYTDRQWNCDFLVGDVDNNGDVNLEDAAKVLKYALLIEKGNTLESFLADYDGDKDIDLSDAELTLKTALRINQEEQCHIAPAFPAYKHDNADMGIFTKYFDTSEELKLHAQMYENEEYKELMSGACDFLDYNDGPDAVLPLGDGSGTTVENPSKELKRNVITMNIEVPECEEYFMEYVCNGNSKLLYIYAADPLENGKNTYLATYKEDVVLPDSNFSGVYIDVHKN